ncbi:hypothetical protein MMSR116_18565 [Methylobacterium mesophilicum SR1.6/6]|uniref:Uncharacterized protein n=1 Tax=Methylobacterium mesophilicum SR1.6/6 TaxID=908290 RepID=A0A6B9FM28_9HYPH|nr:hypothetical protein [Methylobacterium mesophilicum]QGY03671.1 hypothetical protein MMSR116_18565 [Methylobacterium mesophilicum SR1.6/6]
MTLDDAVRDAILAELKRQAEAEDPAPQVDLSEPGYARITGRIDLEALQMVIAGATAGGP